jgi:hypothetical protein
MTAREGVNQSVSRLSKTSNLTKKKKKKVVKRRKSKVSQLSKAKKRNLKRPASDINASVDDDDEVSRVVSRGKSIKSNKTGKSVKYNNHDKAVSEGNSYITDSIDSEDFDYTPMGTRRNRKDAKKAMPASAGSN